MPERIHFLVCQNFLPEVEAVLGGGDPLLEGVTASAFPSRCGRPPLLAEEIRQALPEGAVPVQVVGSACLSALANEACGSCRTTRIGPCFDLVADRQLVRQLLQEGDYLVTPGWLARWRELVAAWGFDEDGLRAFLRETTRRIHLLDTGTLADAPDHLRELAGHVGLPSETTWTGLDHLALELRGIVLCRRLELQRARSESALRQLHQKSADYAMVVDLLERFSAAGRERDAIEKVLEIFTMLFAPRELAYVAFEEGQCARIHCPGSDPRPVDEATRARVATFEGDEAWNEATHSILLRLGDARGTFGVVVVDRVACPEFGAHYANLTHAILPVCGLSVGNARDREELLRTDAALRDANQKLALLATVDGLTGIPNRRRFDERLQAECRRSIREESPLSVILLDVDHFKAFNDAYGHLAGDDCLKRIARVLFECIGRPDDLVARWGGEEFVVLLPGTSAPGASRVAERIRVNVREERIPHRASPVDPNVTVSLGTATVLAQEASDASRLVSLADEALYEAKAAGRNRSIARECALAAAGRARRGARTPGTVEAGPGGA